MVIKHTGMNKLKKLSMYSLSVILLFFCCLHVSFSQDIAISKLELKDGFDQDVIDQIVQKISEFADSTELSICIIQAGEANFYGVQRIADELINIDNQNHVFSIGSITKVFTSALLTTAVMENKLALMDPLDQYLPFKLKKNTSIPLMYLSNHTSGLPRLSPELMRAAIFNLDNPYINYDDEKLEDYLKKKMKIKELPGEVYEYSNLGAGILGYTMEHIYDQSYERLIQEKVCKPLEMMSTSTSLDGLENRFISGRNPNGAKAHTWEFDALKGAGAVFSTTSDLAKLALAQMDSTYEVFQLMHEKTFTISEVMSIGLGWLILSNKSGNDWIFHNGATNGYSSCMVLDKINKDGVIVLSNIGAFHTNSANVDALCFDIMRIIQKLD